MSSIRHQLFDRLGARAYYGWTILAVAGFGLFAMAAPRPGVFGSEPYQSMDRSDGLYRLMEGSIATDWDFPWEKLVLPVLVMTGHHDRVFRVAEDIDELAARLPDVERQEVPNAGHLIPVERPAQFARALLEFAGRLG